MDMTDYSHRTSGAVLGPTSPGTQAQLELVVVSPAVEIHIGGFRHEVGSTP